MNENAWAMEAFLSPLSKRITEEEDQASEDLAS